MRLSELAAMVNGRVEGDPSAEIRGVARIEDAAEGQITFLANPKYRKHLETTGASAVLVPSSSLPPGSPPRGGISFVAVDDAYAAFMSLVDFFHPAPARPPAGVDPGARVSPSAVIGAGASIAAFAVIGDGCAVGARTIVSHGVVLGEGVSVGEDSHLMANVVVTHGCRLGRRVIVHPGVVIGSDGFGFAPTGQGTWDKIPQRGIVVIEDDVDIGANTTIDRATFGETRICRGAKLDNLIQVGHNVVIGEDTVIVAQAGIAGSTRIGRHCVIAGQVGIIGHLTIADNVTIAAQSGVSKSLPEKGSTWFGSPAKEHRRALRIEGAIRQLPELIEDVRALKRELGAGEGSAPAPPRTPPPSKDGASE
jgi:UDP-3-O-[3-hydroxymyristoyl] glucosamine N-acyltransferase